MTGVWREWKEGRQLLAPAERSRLRGVFLLMVAAAIFESAAVASFLPFLEVAADPGAIERRAWLSGLHAAIGSPSPRVFLAVLGAVTLATMVGGNALAAWSQSRVTRFAWDAYRSLSHRILDAYLAAPYVEHLKRNASDQVRGITGETGNFVGGWLLPALQAASRGIVAVLLVATLVAVEPFAALVALATVGGAYAAILLVVRRRLDRLSHERDHASQRLHQVATEAMSAFREVRLYDTREAVVADFDHAASAFTRAHILAQLISVLPKYAVEVLALGSVVGLGVLLADPSVGGTSAIAFLGLFAMAGYRLVPALQTCFVGRASMRLAGASRDRLARDLAGPRDDSEPATGPAGDPALPRPGPTQEFGLENVTFRYPGTSGPVLRNITAHVPVGRTTRIVGRTGSGKSTLLDLLLGLIEPQSGRRVADGCPISTDALGGWRRQFAYVSQTPVLLDASIAENIAFGVRKDRIDLARVRRAAHVACIDEFVEGDLPEGYETLVGDRACRLSGGQRQRLAIARAIYAGRPILVLDEATNALDDATERAVFDRLEALRPRPTIVLVTHRGEGGARAVAGEVVLGDVAPASGTDSGEDTSRWAGSAARARAE